MRTWMYFEIDTDNFSESAIKKSYHKLNKEFGVFGITYTEGFKMWYSVNYRGEEGSSGSKAIKFYKLSLRTSFSLS